MNRHQALWRDFLGDGRRLVEGCNPLEVSGRLTRINGLVMEAAGIKLPLGSGYRILVPGGGAVEAEVVGFNGDKLYMMPTDDVFGLAPGARVLPMEVGVPRLVPGKRIGPRRRAADRAKHLPVGDALLGRVVDGAGRPLDGQGPLHTQETRSLQGRAINPLARAPIAQPLDVGVRAINALLTVGRGQRLGLFAGTGVGKSVLLGMMARYTAADVIVVGLIGERGREVKEFIEDILEEEGRARSVVVAAPADAPPLVRMQGASYATAIAEHFRDRGRHVLLLMDSLTRYAMAQREIALAIGEPPATKGYPPSVFARLPQLVERSGNGLAGVGSITALYTVLTEGDDPQDPIADAARGILDGHIVLSRELAESGHFPAIDVERSISRVMTAVASREQVAASRRIRHWLSRLTKARDLIQLGAYQPGHDADLDVAVRLAPQLEAFLQQDMHEAAALDASRAHLFALAAH